ncbi:MAG: PDGLE domain-containing protein [Endomicrobium sp.]|jgi:hypothetical protein|nr:PDGLE domain-containing protein [Endomicrobium sp.]
MNRKKFFVAIPIFVVFFSSLFASRCPDILETLVINRNISKQSREVTSVFANYSVPFVNDKSLSTFFAGLVGLLVLNIIYKGLHGVVKHFINKQWTKDE